MSTAPLRDRFPEIGVGDEARLSHTLTAQDVDRFQALTGDDNPLHTDPAYAAQVGFGRPVAHGMLTASFLSRLIGTELPGPGALWFEQTLRFPAPARIGERITVAARVLQKSEAQRVLVLHTLVTGQDGRTLVEGEAKVKVLEPQPEEIPMPTNTGTVIVTGASRGIGAAAAQALARAGFAVAVNYRDDCAGAQAVVRAVLDAGGRAAAFQADVCDTAAVAAMVEEAERTLGPLAGAVSNAGGPVGLATFAETAWSDFTGHLDVQLKGAVNLFQAVLPRLTAQGGGCLVTVGSTAAEGVPPARMTAYAAAKAALMCLTRSLAQEFGPQGIRVNCVAPGMVNTGLITDFPDKARMVAKMQAPLRRLAEPGDVASTVAWLFDPAAGFITGQTLRVCGGAAMA